MADLNTVLTKGRRVKLAATNREDISKCVYQVVYAISDPSNGEGGILLNPQVGAQYPLPIFIALTGDETLAGTMLTVPAIAGVLRLDPTDIAQFIWPDANSELLNTADNTTYKLGDVLGDPSEYASPDAVAPVAPVAPAQPVAPVQPTQPLVPPAPIAGFDYDAWAAFFNEKSQRTFKPTGGSDQSNDPNSPDQYTATNGFNKYAGVCFQTVRANRTGVLGRAEDASPYKGDLVFFPFQPDFSPLLDPPGTFQFTTSVTEKSRVYTPSYYTTSTYVDYVDYDSFWVDPYWGGGWGVGIVLY